MIESSERLARERSLSDITMGTIPASSRWMLVSLISLVTAEVVAGW